MDMLEKLKIDELIECQQVRVKNAIDFAKRTIEDAIRTGADGHLGHNLSSRAHEITEETTKLQVLKDMKQRLQFVIEFSKE